MSDESLADKAQSLLDALRAKGLHVPNAARVDNDGDALEVLCEEIRRIARGGDVSLAAHFADGGAVDVRVGGADARAAATAEARVFAPWAPGPRLVRGVVRGGGARLEGVGRDGPVNVIVRDAAGEPLAWGPATDALHAPR